MSSGALDEDGFVSKYLQEGGGNNGSCWARFPGKQELAGSCGSRHEIKNGWRQHDEDEKLLVWWWAGYA